MCGGKRMRNLQSSDIFAACRLMNAIGIKEEFKKMAEKANSLSDLKSFDTGYDFLFMIFERATTSEAEKEWYSFLGNIFEMKPNEVKVMDPCELLDKLVEVADISKWKDFFSRVAKLMK